MVELFAQKTGGLQLDVHRKDSLQGVKFGIAQAVVLLEKKPFEPFVARFVRGLLAQAPPGSIQALIKQFHHVKPAEHARGLRETGGRYGQIWLPEVAANGGYLLTKIWAKSLVISN